MDSFSIKVMEVSLRHSELFRFMIQNQHTASLAGRVLEKLHNFNLNSM
jgi:hypothetical protein